MSNIRSGRRKGGQPGNVNRLKHGLYSRRLSLQQEAHLASSPRSNTDFELGLARVRLVQLVKQQQSASPRDWLAFERAVIHYITLITGLIEANAARNESHPAFVGIMESIRALNEDYEDSESIDSNLNRTSGGFRPSTRD